MSQWVLNDFWLFPVWFCNLKIKNFNFKIKKKHKKRLKDAQITSIVYTEFSIK